jgi:polysaccharide biosynthesis transport protein
MKTDRSVDASTPGKNGRLPQDSLLETSDLDALPEKKAGFRPLLRTIQRNILLVAGIATVVTVAGVAAFKAKSASPTYDGSFQLLVEPVTNEARAAEPLSVTRSDGQVPNQDTFGLDYPTQISILTSPKLLSRIAQLVQTRYPGFDEIDLASLLTVQRGVITTTSEKTKTIEVHYQGTDADLVRFVLQEASQEYLRYSLQDRKTRIGAGVEFINQQLPAVQKRVENFQRQLENLQQQYGLISPEEQGNQLSTQIGDITTLKLETQRQLREQQTLYASLQKQLNLTPSEAIAASALTEDPGYRDSITKLQDIESQIAVETARLTENSPIVRSLRQRQQNLSDLSNQQSQRIIGTSLPDQPNAPQVLMFQNSVRLDLIKELVTAANQIQILEARNQEISQAVGVYNQRLEQFPAIARRYNDLQRQLDIATRTLDQLQTQRDTLGVQAAQNEVPWELVSFSEPAPVPSKAKLLIVVGLMLGVVSGVGAAVLVEKVRDVFFSIEDIQDATQMPILGTIPFSKDADRLPNLTALTATTEGFASTEGNASAFQEAFSALYASIYFLSSDPPIRSFVISSATPGDGKTTIAINLAQSVAMMGKKVLLVDANLRSPEFSRKLDLIHSKGLSEVLVNDLNVDELIQQSPLSNNLLVLASGQSTPEAVRLLGSDQMQKLMEQLEANFDLVIYDTPHLQGLTDASFLAAHTNGILLVLGVGTTRKSVVMQVLSELRNFGLPEIGIISNHLDRRTKSSNSRDGQQYLEIENTLQPQALNMPQSGQTISSLSETQP